MSSLTFEKWYTDSTPCKDMGQAFAMISPQQQRLTTMRMLPKRVVHPKAKTLAEALAGYQKKSFGMPKKDKSGTKIWSHNKSLIKKWTKKNKNKKTPPIATVDTLKRKIWPAFLFHNYIPPEDQTPDDKSCHVHVTASHRLPIPSTPKKHNWLAKGMPPTHVSSQNPK